MKANFISPGEWYVTNKANDDSCLRMDHLVLVPLGNDV